MTLVDALQLPVFDYTDPALRGERFHAAMAELRESAGPARDSGSAPSPGDGRGGATEADSAGWLASGPFGYIVLDRESAEFFLRSRSATFPGMKIAEIFGVTEGPLYEQMKRNILHVNGPDHTRLRSLVNPALSPRAVERYRPAMRMFLAELFADISEAGRCDFVEAFAKPYPSQVIAHVMGAPIEDAPKLHHWSNWIQRQFDAASMASERAGIERAVEEFYAYAQALLEARRADPRDDLISILIEAEEHGESGRLSDVECINLVFNVLVGAVDTSQSQLAHAVRLLAQHPEQWRALAEDPSLAGQAVEEALRYEPITPFTARILTEEISFRGVTFPEGTIVMVCAFTGNRELDDGTARAGAGVCATDADADRFDITADRGRARALTFGAGVHYCLGANLARAELEEALAFLAPRMPDLRLDGEPVYESITGIYGLAELPVRFSV
ncbi:MAG TPA: cytochrome P450 [Solirubrobacteraceae bacterium]|jgi:cytochrome P450